MFRQGELSFHSAGNGRQGEEIKRKKKCLKKKMEGQIQPEQLVASCITQVLMDKGNLEIENHHYYRMFKIVFIFILMHVINPKIITGKVNMPRAVATRRSAFPAYLKINNHSIDYKQTINNQYQYSTNQPIKHIMVKPSFGE